MHIAEYENPRVVVFVYVFYLYNFWFLCVNLWKIFWLSFIRLWQMGRDSNPRKLALYTRSRRAPSTARTPIYEAWIIAKI